MKKLKETQQSQTQEGGEDMRKETQSQQGGMYFVTFTRKLSQEQTKLILAELRKQFPGQMSVFVPRPPGKTKRVILEINGELVIISFPAHRETETKENPKQQSTEGFKLSELIKNKI